MCGEVIFESELVKDNSADSEMNSGAISDLNYKKQKPGWDISHGDKEKEM